jgi:hypothetical protein
MSRFLKKLGPLGKKLSDKTPEPVAVAGLIACLVAGIISGGWIVYDLYNSPLSFIGMIADWWQPAVWWIIALKVLFTVAALVGWLFIGALIVIFVGFLIWNILGDG